MEKDGLYRQITGYRLNLLGDRELQVLEALGKGLNNQQIAELLGVSAKTVGTYKTRLMKKPRSTPLKN